MGAGASVTDTKEVPGKGAFKWDHAARDMDATDIRDLQAATLEIERVRTLASSSMKKMTCGPKIAEYFAKQKGDPLFMSDGNHVRNGEPASFEEALEYVKELRQLVRTLHIINGIHDIFDRIDKDHDNCITREEMSGYLFKFRQHAKRKSRHSTDAAKLTINGMNENVIQEAQKIFDRADYTYSHTLDFAEFYEFMMTLFHVAFDRIDKEGKGVIDRDHFAQLLHFIYGKNLGVGAERRSSMTKQGQGLLMQRTVKQKNEELQKEIGKTPITRGLFVEYLLHCYQAHHCKRLYYNLMHMSVSDEEWSHAHQEAHGDIEALREVENASNLTSMTSESVLLHGVAHAEEANNHAPAAAAAAEESAATAASAES